MTRKLLFLTAIVVVAGMSGCCRRETAMAPEPMLEPQIIRDPCGAPEMAQDMQSAGAIRLEKMAPTEIRANEPFEYRIKVTNISDRTVTNVMVSDFMPEGMAIESSDPVVTELDQRGAHWMLGSMESGMSRMITINAIARGTGTVTSCAHVSYDSPVCARMTIVESPLQLAKEIPEDSLSCDRIPVKYVLTNTGNAHACDIEIRDQLPEGLVTAQGENSLLFTLDSLGPGESREFTAMLDATTTGKFSSSAMASARTSGKIASNMTTTVVTQPVLKLTEVAPKMQFIGKEMAYEWTIQNTGDGIAKDTMLIANLPAGINFKNATMEGVYTHSSPGKVTWNLGQIEPNDSKTVRMVISSRSKGDVATSASATAHCAEEVKTEAVTQVQGIPAILLEVVDVSDPIEVGQTGTYMITITNQGSADGTNIQVMCDFESSMQYLSSTGPTEGTYQDGRLTFSPLTNLATNEKAVWQVQIKALEKADCRFKVMLQSDQLSRPVEETESTHLFE